MTENNTPGKPSEASCAQRWGGVEKWGGVSPISLGLISRVRCTCLRRHHHRSTQRSSPAPSISHGGFDISGESTWNFGGACRPWKRLTKGNGLCLVYDTWPSSCAHPSVPEERSTKESMRLLIGQTDRDVAVCTRRTPMNVAANSTVLRQTG